MYWPIKAVIFNIGHFQVWKDKAANKTACEQCHLTLNLPQDLLLNIFVCLNKWFHEDKCL